MVERTVQEVQGYRTERIRRAGLDAITRHGLALAVVVLLSVSGGVLWVLGYNYDGLSGSAATKIHPATYITLIIFGWRACTFGNPLRYVAHVADQRPSTALLLALTTVILVFVILRQRPNMAGLVDTFMGATFLVLLLSDADDRLMTRLRQVIHAIMTVNALLGLFEFATKHLLFPFRFDGQAFETDLRSSALQGHPLINAAVTACYVLSLISGARDLTQARRLAMIGLQLAALVAFGGRTAFVLTLLFGGVYALGQSGRALRRGRVSLPAAAMVFLFVSLAPVVLVFLISQGFFDAFASRFVADGGSANARILMFELFDHFSVSEIIIGPPLDLLESLRRIYGLEWGIENPIIRMTLYQGAFVTLLLTVGFGLFMYEISRQCLRGVWLPMMVWLLIINTAESIASKTTLMTKFCVIILCMYHASTVRPVPPLSVRR
ncbi:VpsF family polysaccharide biosynthesis protein [Rhizobium sp. SAFR-030]|uniref:VpsF family polysaccharide biosynthesis protein n=1 Tax=Rhizobium sp. SAFR-030 TaxID=3387277 RepID=UPI003F7DF1E6